eukprot:1146572-Pelagomonas_calceolata.AAC.2
MRAGRLTRASNARMCSPACALCIHFSWLALANKTTTLLVPAYELTSRMRCKLLYLSRKAGMCVYGKERRGLHSCVFKHRLQGYNGISISAK